MTDKKEIIVHGVDVSEWTDEEIRYNFEKHSPKAIRQIAFDLYKQLKRKEQECEELKQWKEDAENLFKTQTDNADKIINRYKHTLDEIEENIKAMNNECFYDDICECNNCDMKNGCTYYRKFNILNIINKAKGGVNGNT